MVGWGLRGWGQPESGVVGGIGFRLLLGVGVIRFVYRFLNND